MEPRRALVALKKRGFAVGLLVQGDPDVSRIAELWTKTSREPSPD
jgi:hypothetical protein